MDKQREAFEAWKKINNALGYGLSRNNTPGSDLDGYEDAYTQGQWAAWRAAQAAQPNKVEQAINSQGIPTHANLASKEDL